MMKPLIFLVLLTLLACKRDNPNPNNPGAGEEEVITTIQLTFQNQADTSDHFTRQWVDADGIGSGAPVIDSIFLKPSTTYAVSIALKDEINNKDITEEIREEANYHRFHYVFAPTALATTTITDQDDNNQPLGLTFTLTTATPGKGTLNVVLRHFANNVVKTGGVSDGEEDVNVGFGVGVR
jgi:hypothetical protein